jgi:hypothetical protein
MSQLPDVPFLNYVCGAIAKMYAVHANALKISKLDYKYVRINYLSKYSKYADRLLINIFLYSLQSAMNATNVTFPIHQVTVRVLGIFTVDSNSSLRGCLENCL